METQCDSDADERARGSNLGLTTAFQKYLAAYFEARRKNGGKACKGEEICAKIGAPDGNPGLRDKSRPIETICEACAFFRTKPAAMSMQVAALAITAYRMEALFESGAGVEYPNLFTPLEWECFLTLKYARASDEEKAFEKLDKQQSQASAQATLEARLKRS